MSEPGHNSPSEEPQCFLAEVAGFLALLGLLPMYGVFGSIPAIILGGCVLRRIRRNCRVARSRGWYEDRRRDVRVGLCTAWFAIGLGLLTTTANASMIVHAQSKARSAQKEVADLSAMNAIYRAFEAYAQANNGLLPSPDTDWRALLVQTGHVRPEQFFSAWDRDEEPDVWYLPHERLTPEVDRPLMLWHQETKSEAWKVLDHASGRSYVDKAELKTLQSLAVPASAQ